MTTSYIAFISYKHIERDAAIAKKVHSLIESYIIPRELRTKGKKLGVVFRDEEELPISSDLSESIRSALDVSHYLIVVCSPEAKASPWVSREIGYFLEKHDVKDVFVILANGDPADVFPYAITHINDADISPTPEIFLIDVFFCEPFVVVGKNVLDLKGVLSLSIHIVAVVRSYLGLFFDEACNTS